MAHVFRAATFIAPASAKSNTESDIRGNDSMSKLVEDYLTAKDAGGGSADIDEVISVSSCGLSGGRVFVFVVIEDETGGGG